RDYQSPSKAWLLDVDPTQRNGAGPAHYRVTHDGTLAWEHDFPFTFRSAFIADDGTAVGWAYADEFGYDGGEFVFACIASDGIVRSEDGCAIEQGPPGELSRPHTYPQVYDFNPYPDVDRVVVMVSSPHPLDGNEWWIYGISSGKLLGRSGTRPDYALPSA